MATVTQALQQQIQQSQEVHPQALQLTAHPLTSRCLYLVTCLRFRAMLYTPAAPITANQVNLLTSRHSYLPNAPTWVGTRLRTVVLRLSYNLCLCLRGRQAG